MIISLVDYLKNKNNNSYWYECKQTSVSLWNQPNFDCNCTFPFDLAPDIMPFIYQLYIASIVFQSTSAVCVCVWLLSIFVSTIYMYVYIYIWYMYPIYVVSWHAVSGFFFQFISAVWFCICFICIFVTIIYIYWYLCPVYVVSWHTVCVPNAVLSNWVYWLFRM